MKHTQIRTAIVSNVVMDVNNWPKQKIPNKHNCSSLPCAAASAFSLTANSQIRKVITIEKRCTVAMIWNYIGVSTYNCGETAVHLDAKILAVHIFWLRQNVSHGFMNEKQHVFYESSMRLAVSFWMLDDRSIHCLILSLLSNCSGHLKKINPVRSFIYREKCVYKWWPRTLYASHLFGRFWQRQAIRWTIKLAKLRARNESKVPKILELAHYEKERSQPTTDWTGSW